MRHSVLFAMTVQIFYFDSIGFFFVVFVVRSFWAALLLIKRKALKQLKMRFEDYNFHSKWRRRNLVPMLRRKRSKSLLAWMELLYKWVTIWTLNLDKWIRTFIYNLLNRKFYYLYQIESNRRNREEQKFCTNFRCITFHIVLMKKVSRNSLGKS